MQFLESDGTEEIVLDTYRMSTHLWLINTCFIYPSTCEHLSRQARTVLNLLPFITIYYLLPSLLSWFWIILINFNPKIMLHFICVPEVKIHISTVHWDVQGHPQVNVKTIHNEATNDIMESSGKGIRSSVYIISCTQCNESLCYDDNFIRSIHTWHWIINHVITDIFIALYYSLSILIEFEVVQMLND